MGSIFLGVVPPILIFFLGYFLKRIGILNEDNATVLLKLVFYVSLPALIFLSLLNLEITSDFLKIPLISILIAFSCFIVSFFVSKFFNLSKKTLGVFLIGPMLLNTSLSIPFVLATFGEEGLALLSLYIFGNAIIIFTFVYYIACYYGKQKQDSSILMKFLLFPILWGMLAAIILNLTNVAVPVVINDWFQILGNLTIPLLMISLGAYFNLKLRNLPLLFSALGIRYIVGLCVGFVLVSIFNLDGLSRVIVLIGSASPIGNNVLTFATLENLDIKFATSLVSLSVITGIFVIPLLVILLS